MSPTLADYFALDKKIGELTQQGISPGYTPLRIALLASFTIRGLKEALKVKCFDVNIAAEFFEGGYHQYAQEILNHESALYSFQPNLVILMIDTRSLVGDALFSFFQLDDAARTRWEEETFQHLTRLIETLIHASSATIIVHNLEAPTSSPLGILEGKQPGSIIAAIQKLNLRLTHAYAPRARVYVFDYDGFTSRHGKLHTFDEKLYYLADMKLAPDYLPLLADEYLAYIKPLASRTRKCIVLDLDNTLWGGILGEDGIEGILLGPTPEGRPFLEFQKYLLALSQRGIILAVNSKNNLEEVRHVFRHHPALVLREEHFATMKVNWEDKITNFKALAEELNIGLDSMVFVDDDPANREMVSEALPEVLVVPLPEDPARYLATIASLNDFNTLQLTDEDRDKALHYAQQRQRKELEAATGSLEEYLKKLEMRVTIKKADVLAIPRVAQLTQKTNQFNMTTRRYLEDDIRARADNARWLVVTVQVEDKFGDNGLTGLTIIERQPQVWRIDTFLLSCRIIGRGVEDALLAAIIDAARALAIPRITGEFIPTAKNAPAQHFYEKSGFQRRNTQAQDGMQYWDYDVTRAFSSPTHMTIINELKASPAV